MLKRENKNGIISYSTLLDFFINFCVEINCNFTCNFLIFIDILYFYISGKDINFFYIYCNDGMTQKSPLMTLSVWHELIMIMRKHSMFMTEINFYWTIFTVFNAD